MADSREPTADASELARGQQLGHLLWETSSRAAVLAEAGLIGTALTVPALGLLDMVATWPGITVAEISRRVPKTQQAISQVASRLEKLGFIERRLGPRRGIGLHITPDGEKARRVGSVHEEESELHLRELLGTDRYDKLCALLGEALDRLARETGMLDDNPELAARIEQHTS